jgi:hypothetical protein
LFSNASAVKAKSQTTLTIDDDLLKVAEKLANKPLL